MLNVRLSASELKVLSKAKQIKAVLAAAAASDTAADQLIASEIDQYERRQNLIIAEKAAKKAEEEDSRPILAAHCPREDAADIANAVLSSMFQPQGVPPCQKS